MLKTIFFESFPADEFCVTPDLSPEINSQSDPKTMSYRQKIVLLSGFIGKYADSICPEIFKWKMLSVSMMPFLLFVSLVAMETIF